MATKRQLIVGFGLVALILLFTACAPAGYTEKQYGFWGGLWHGLIFGIDLTLKCISYLLNLLNDDWGNWDIGLWADNRTGFTYWLGYCIGLLSHGLGKVGYHR